MNYSSESPLFIAVYNGDLPTLELLINSGKNFKNTHLVPC